MSGRGRGRGRHGRGITSSPSPTIESSSTHTAGTDEEMYDMDAEDAIVNGEEGFVTLHPDGTWFHSNQVKRTVKEVILSNFNEFATSWTSASQDQRDRWWYAFRSQYSFEARHEQQIREAFEHYAINRIRDYIYRARSSPDARAWMSAEYRSQFEAMIGSPAFQEKSPKKKLNRASSSSEGGKASGTHAMGRRGVMDFARSMELSRGALPSVVELVSSSKKKKSGNYVSRKFESIMASFTSKKSQAQETQPDTPVDDSRLYYEVAGGYDKKGRVYGMGSAASMYYERPAAATRHSSAEAYAPGIVTRLTQEMARERQINLETQARLEELERDRKRQDDRLAQLEALMAERFGSMPPEGCNPGPRDRRDDPPFGPGGGDVGLGTPGVV